MPDEYDFLANLSADDQAMIQAKNRAKARQEAAHAGVKVPTTEKEADEAHEAAAKQLAAAINAGDEATRLAGGTVVPAQQSQSISIWAVDGAMDRLLAPTWKQLKEDLKSLDGTWKILHFELSFTFDQIVGFFRPSPKIIFPDAALKESFIVIVKDATVFRSDPE